MYKYAPYSYIPPQELTNRHVRHPVMIVGAGPIGLSMAIDLALHGIGSVLLDENNVVSVGSRAICWAKRSLEIFDRLGVGKRMLRKGVTWKVGRQFHGEKELYSFDLLPEAGHKFPAFINLQQYYVEEYLIDRVREFPNLIDLRFKHKVIDHKDTGEHVVAQVSTEDGQYELEADWYIACDGASSATRERMELKFVGKTFEEQFLIADVEMADSPWGSNAIPERWFWFDPPFHQGKSALVHVQPDNIYRIDLQLDESDPHNNADAAVINSKIKAIIGDKPFRLDWASVYRFRCAQIEKFVHGRVIFAGDSAHVVSPFGARGGNGGIQDVDNLGWKLAAIIKGESPQHLIETYDEERTYGSAENIRNSSRATNFMTPKSSIESLFRTETLRLAADQPFARNLLNSGRLSIPCALEHFSLQTPSLAPVSVGTAALDAPLSGQNGNSWLIEHVQGQFTAVGFGRAVLPKIDGIKSIGINQQAEYACYSAKDSIAIERYGKDIAYIFRPDGHICAAFKTPTLEKISAAVSRAKGLH